MGTLSGDMLKRRSFRGAVHAHTTLSHDGTLSLAELTEFLREKGYDYLALTEHSHDVTIADMESLEAEARDLSSSDFLIIPGLEFRCHDYIDIIGYGVTAICLSDDPIVVIDHIRAHGGVAVLAHPTIRKYPLSMQWICHLDGCEIWNVANEGKFLPQAQTLNKYVELSRQCPGLRAYVGLDLHRRVSFYKVIVLTSSECVTREAILSALRLGQFSLTSRFFSAESSGRLRLWYRAYVSVARRTFDIVKAIRDGVFRWGK